MSTRLLDGGKPDAALGLAVKGGNSKLKQWNDMKQRHIACGTIIAEAKSGRHRSWSEVYDHVADEMDVERETIERWWYDKSLEWSEAPTLP